jgi:hypothetical protein
MPSQLHEAHLFLFRNQPTLAAQLIRDALGVTLPPFRDVHIASADLTDLRPTEYRADLVIELSSDSPVYGIVVEVQLSIDERKQYVWPAYVANLRARMRCPVSLLVVTADDSVARWAARGVDMGGLHPFAPYVIGPSRIPAIADEKQARDNPELAVLSAMAHGRDSDAVQASAIALAAHNASLGLDVDRAKIYCDLIVNSLGEAARQALNNMDARTYEYQSDFARQYIAQGRAEGEAAGRAAVILRLLTVRFGVIEAQVQGRIQGASPSELDLIGERILTARTLEEALGGRIQVSTK